MRNQPTDRPLLVCILAAPVVASPGLDQMNDARKLRLGKDASSSLPNPENAAAAPTGNLLGGDKASVNILDVRYRHSF